MFTLFILMFLCNFTPISPMQELQHGLHDSNSVDNGYSAYIQNIENDSAAISYKNCMEKFQAKWQLPSISPHAFTEFEKESTQMVRSIIKSFERIASYVHTGEAYPHEAIPYIKRGLTQGIIWATRDYIHDNRIIFVEDGTFGVSSRALKKLFSFGSTYKKDPLMKQAVKDIWHVMCGANQIAHVELKNNDL